MSEEVELQHVLALKVKDQDLMFLNDIVNRTNCGIGITLFVKGNVISGSLIAGRKYYGFVSENLKAIGSVGEALCKRLARTVLIFTERSEQLSRATDRVPGLPASPGYAQ